MNSQVEDWRLTLLAHYLYLARGQSLDDDDIVELMWLVNQELAGYEKIAAVGNEKLCDIYVQSMGDRLLKFESEPVAMDLAMGFLNNTNLMGKLSIKLEEWK